MPYKEAVKLKTKSGCIKPIQKSQYKVANWTEYNKSLRNHAN